MTNAVAPASATARLDRIAVKDGVSLGLLGAADREAVLAHAALHLPASGALDERAVNASLITHLDRGGAMLRTDHVELRRTLVDSGWVQRDGYGRRYVLAPDAPARAAALLGDVDAETLDLRIATVRRAHAEARRLRREQHVPS